MSERPKLNIYKLSIEEAIEQSCVRFSFSHLVKISAPLREDGSSLESVLPKIGSEKLANMLHDEGIYGDEHISSAWEDVCKMRRFRVGIETKLDIYVKPNEI